ncbi:MAG TPA: hypothetical protein VE377_22790 [Candidatus Dormibacteraeota bacterium]|nr:hypothetical protein [Candidatus Dormibacteraeota bacterium]
MGFRGAGVLLFCLISITAPIVRAQAPAQSESSSSNSPKHGKKLAAAVPLAIDAGSISNGAYHNKALALVCKIPAGWVLRTEEMNGRDDGDRVPGEDSQPSPQGAQRSTEDQRGGRVLLAAFSRPPEAKGEEVNASIVIAAESAAAYPGLKEAAQYFGPLTEVAKAQGFTVDEEPYEIAMDAKVVVRGDFHKDVGTRVMRQSTLVFLARGYAVSITVIGGTEDEVEELVDGVGFGAEKGAAK